MPPTTRKRQESVVEPPTVPVTRAKRKAAQRKNPSTSTLTTRPRRRPAATTAPRKTAYKDKRGQTPALPTVQASSDAETEEETDDVSTSPQPTRQADPSSNDSTGQREAARTPRKRKAGPKGGHEPEKGIDSQVNDSSSSSSGGEDAIVAGNLLTPRKRQKHGPASSEEEEEHQDKGNMTARAGTVIPETDYEGPVLTSPQRSPRRAGQKTYGKQRRPDKGKGKAVDPAPSPPVAQGGPAEEEEAGESDRSADSDRREDEEVADQQQPVASTSRKPSQKKSSGNTPHRSPPKKRVVASASQKSPARRPASSSHPHRSLAKEKAQQQNSPSGTDSASSEGERQPARDQTFPRRHFELAPSEDEAIDDGEDETKTMYPPQIFQHRGYTEAEEGGRERGWVPDRFWVHDQWVSPGKREQVVAFIEANGGRVVKSMKKAHIAVLPPWYSEGYRDLYADARASGAVPVVYAWVQDCARKSAKEGRAVRLSRFDYTAPLPRTRTDGRSKRYLRLTYEVTEKFARLYARWTRKEISRGEMLERMQSQFFDGTKCTTIDGFDASLKENERQIKSMAKRINREATRQYTDSEPDGNATDAAARTEDEAYEGMRKSRSRSQSQSRPRPRPASSSAARQREVDDRVDEAEAAELEALPALAAKHGRTLHLVQSIYLACAFDLESTGTVLDILKEFDLGTVGLSPNSADSDQYRKAMQTARDQILDRVEVIWSPSLDRKLLQRGPKSDAKVARDKNIAIEKVRERREALEVIHGTGIESWYPDEEGFKRWRREMADGDEEEEEAGESGLEPLDGPAAAE